jgi:adenine-specific DNA-methyltransferase
MAVKNNKPKEIATLTHDEAKRKNIPTAEYQSVVEKEQQTPIQIAYERRNRDLDPQLVWRGKDEQDWSDLVVTVPPLYIQEKVHPKALIDELLRESRERKHEAGEIMPSLFADFNGLPKGVDKTEFYQHDQNWSNRMILGDSLQVMASLAEREGLRGKVQCIYFDPPYGIKFNSNFQWSTTSRNGKDGNAAHITREPEQVKAFRDTWRDGIHSYLTYLRDRLTVARDLLSPFGSIFVQISDENVHRLRSVMDEIFGPQNCVSLITYYTSGGRAAAQLPTTANYLIWYCKDIQSVKFRRLFREKAQGGLGSGEFSWVTFPGGLSRRLTREEYENSDKFPTDGILCIPSDLTSSHEYIRDRISYNGSEFAPGGRYWSTSVAGMARLARADRFIVQGSTLRYKRLYEDFPYREFDNIWSDTAARGFYDQKVYVVQTGTQIVQRCVLMTTDVGDLVLDPTCGSGTSATVAEQWGRRWITIDTSRVALALARARIMAGRYPYYFLADSRDGQMKEAEITGSAPSSQPVRGDVRHGFVLERVPRMIMKSIANNAEIDVIWEKWQKTLEPLRQRLNDALMKSEEGRGKSEKKQAHSDSLHSFEEWEIPHDADPKWSAEAKTLHADWWQARLARQKEIDASIAAKAEFEFLYDKPYEDKRKVRVAGPFTVESLSPHRVLGVDENDDLIDSIANRKTGYEAKQDFPSMILENLRIAGVQQAHKEDRITFTSLTPWPGDLVCADGRYMEGEGASAVEKRAAIFIGPEFGTVSRPDLVEAAREAADGGFDVLIACAFNYDAHATEFAKLGRVPILKARMNADLHMAEDLKNTGKGNLFVIFGEPDITILNQDNGRVRVKVNGVDVFHPSTGEVKSDGPEGIACWFIDTDYNEESFFVRHAYFLGANDPYKALKTTLKAEINEEAWETLHSDISRAFVKPASGRIAVKVINHLGDEVMKVFRVHE